MNVLLDYGIWMDMIVIFTRLQESHVIALAKVLCLFLLSLVRVRPLQLVLREADEDDGNESDVAAEHEQDPSVVLPDVERVLLKVAA